jgi:hypothetical protein
MAKPKMLNGDTTPLAVIDEYATLPGASGARYVRAEDDNEYVMKGPTLSPSNPTVGGNEWVAARLAEAVGLPTLDHRILLKGEDLFFGSAFMGSGTFTPEITAPLFAKCDNRDQIYGIVAFDVWMINSDRHNQNLVVRHRRRSEVQNELLPNDHSHLLVSESEPRLGSELMACLNDPPGRFVCLQFVRESIVNRKLLSTAIDRIENLSERTIRAAVASTPSQLLATTDRAIYADFLVQRRTLLRGLMQNAGRLFPNLEGS